jgi:hypothetical protein
MQGAKYFYKVKFLLNRESNNGPMTNMNEEFVRDNATKLATSY